MGKVTRRIGWLVMSAVFGGATYAAGYGAHCWGTEYRGMALLCGAIAVACFVGMLGSMLAIGGVNDNA